jgi:hypothetical protein
LSSILCTNVFILCFSVVGFEPRASLFCLVFEFIKGHFCLVSPRSVGPPLGQFLSIYSLLNKSCFSDSLHALYDFNLSDTEYLRKQPFLLVLADWLCAREILQWLAGHVLNKVFSEYF